MRSHASDRHARRCIKRYISKEANRHNKQVSPQKPPTPTPLHNGHEIQNGWTPVPFPWTCQRAVPARQARCEDGAGKRVLICFLQVYSVPSKGAIQGQIPKDQDYTILRYYVERF